MTLQSPGLWQENSDLHHAQAYRLLLEGIYGGRAGVFPASTGLKVSQSGTPGMSVVVAEGWYLLDYQDADQGYGAGYNDADVTLVIDAANATNPRIDLIVVRRNDSAIAGTPDTDVDTLEVITGTPAAVPSAPATPKDAMVLARVAVAALATSITNANITDLREPVGSLLTAPIICTSSTRPPTPVSGMRIFETDTGLELTYYDPPGAAAAGWYRPWGQPWGEISYVEVTANQGGISSEVDLTSLTSTFTAIAGRKYRVTFQARVNQATGGLGVVEPKITNAANTILQKGSYVLDANISTTQAHLSLRHVPGAGSITYKARMGTTGGTCGIVAASIQPAFLHVEDIGPS